MLAYGLGDDGTGLAASHFKWLASLQFGFIELDCALIHDTSIDINSQLTQATSPAMDA